MNKLTTLVILSGFILTSHAAYSEEHSEICGEISVFGKPPETKDLFPAVISRLNDDNVIEKSIYRVKPGVYKVKVYERIDDPRLRVTSNSRGRSKILTIDVKENKVYRVAAHFNSNERYSGPSEKYWDPVVWKTEERRCRQ